MDRSPVRDTVVGLFVLAGLGAIAWLSIAIGGYSWHSKGGFILYGDFNETGGLTVRSPVKIAGVRVGEVTEITLGDHARAHITLDLDPSLKLSTDTFASIYTSGMLGDRYIQLAPGGDDRNLKSGDTLSHCDEAMILEKVVGQVITGLTKDNSAKPANPPATPKSP